MGGGGGGGGGGGEKKRKHNEQEFADRKGQHMNPKVKVQKSAVPRKKNPSKSSLLFFLHMNSSLTQTIPEIHMKLIWIKTIMSVSVYVVVVLVILWMINDNAPPLPPPPPSK